MDTLCKLGLLDATVYRSDADAPTAIVSAALREKAIRGLEGVLCADGTMDMGDGVDAVLSTVLGRPVRWMKSGPVVMAFASGNVEVVASLKPTDEERIVILEEAGKEGDR